MVIALGQIMYISGVILVITCSTVLNHWNVYPCSGLLNKSANISLVEQYFSDKYPFSIRYLIKKYHTRMCFVRFHYFL